MFSSSIENLLNQFTANSITELFLYLITAVFILAVVFSLAKRQKRFTSYAAGLMTSLGILGTFVGIVIGLLGFDTTDVAGSIPALLEGLKTAFITSVYGLVGAVIFNIITAFFHSKPKDSDKKKPDTISPVDIYESLEKQHEVLVSIEKGISGTEEGTLIGQFKMLRADNFSELSKQSQSLSQLTLGFSEFSSTYAKDKEVFETKLFESLENFAEMMSKSATEQIIEALKNVIEDFNKNLTEQFGENFKALDASVKSLVTWQQQYKEQVETMGVQYAQSVESLVSTRESVAGIWQECENIPLTMNDLKDILEVNQHQINGLEQHLEAFVSMRDAAVEAVPTIQEKIEEVADQLSQSSSTLQEKLKGTAEALVLGSNEMKASLEEGAVQFKESVTNTGQSFNELSNTVKESSVEVAKVLKDTSVELSNQANITLNEMQQSTESMQKEVLQTVKELESGTKGVTQDISELLRHFDDYKKQTLTDFQSTSEKLLADLQTSLNQSQAALDAHIQSAAEKTGETVNTQLQQLEAATAREIQKAMQELGNALLQVTTRFVDDYQTMVQAMDQVVKTHRH